MTQQTSERSSNDTIPLIPALVLLGGTALLLMWVLSLGGGGRAAVGSNMTLSMPVGARIYAQYCAACHGTNGEGVEMFGPAIVDSNLLDDPAALTEFLVASQPPVDPNVEFVHPTRGGYPALTDEQVAALVEYLQTDIAA